MTELGAAWRLGKCLRPSHSTLACPSLSQLDNDQWKEAGARPWRQRKKEDEPGFQAKLLSLRLQEKYVIVIRVQEN